MTGHYNACKRLKSIIIYLGTMLLMAGCGKEKMPEVTPQPQVQTTEWKSKGFALSGDILEKQELWASWRGQELCIKEDGSTILEDYIALLENCVPYPGTYETIESIVWEEAAAYVSGDKSAAEVARIVDSRVQLYLDERE